MRLTRDSPLAKLQPKETEHFVTQGFASHRLDVEVQPFALLPKDSLEEDEHNSSDEISFNYYKSSVDRLNDSSLCNDERSSVLIVDDEQMNIAVITTMLQVNGVASDSCASGTSCLAKVRNRI